MKKLLLLLVLAAPLCAMQKDDPKDQKNNNTPEQPVDEKWVSDVQTLAALMGMSAENNTDTQPLNPAESAQQPVAPRRIVTGKRTLTQHKSPMTRGGMFGSYAITRAPESQSFQQMPSLQPELPLISQASQEDVANVIQQTLGEVGAQFFGEAFVPSIKQAIEQEEERKEEMAKLEAAIKKMKDDFNKEKKN